MQCPPPPSRVKGLKLISLLGSTRNSLVYVAYDPRSRQKMALKLIHKSIMSVERLDRECEIQFNLEHRYIMPICEYFDIQDFRCILMPRAYGGNLTEFVSQHRNTSQVINSKIMFKVLEAVEFLHYNKILHGDIKPANIVLASTDTNEPCPQIIDFGHACILGKHQLCTCNLMTCIYSAPEVLGFKPHGFPSDIWSLASTFVFLVTGKDILHLKHIEAMYNEALNLKLRFESKEWEMYPDSLKDLLSKMIHHDPSKRPTALQCLNHPFFAEMLGKEWISAEIEKDKINPL
ncbi:hypothetical protein M9Y10_009414 [Tritrichomonas musculus]|uniref:Protein kinase domain-containing protein n=1 Tax=Tritrichomonas musculus TaxID=1915356 RepID=A0ABR2INF9_9EUKA